MNRVDDDYVDYEEERNGVFSKIGRLIKRPEIIFSAIVIIGANLGLFGVSDADLQKQYDVLLGGLREVIGTQEARIMSLEQQLNAAAMPEGATPQLAEPVMMQTLRQRIGSLEEMLSLRDVELEQTRSMLSSERVSAQDALNQAVIEAAQEVENRYAEMACYPRARVDAVDRQLFPGVGPADGGVE